jgi:Na+-transporting methylmalonyl-CoA/oxaloacetate decarboxylase gamma subunit
MTTIGIAYGLGLVILLLLLLPFIVIVWAVSKTTGYFARKAPTERLS